MIRGIKIERARPSNVLDVYALYKDYIQQSAIIQKYWKLTKPELENFYFKLLELLADPHNIFFLARRGKSYCGFIHGVLVPNTFRPSNVLIHVPTAFVLPDKRKLGIASGLCDAIVEEAESLGVSHITLLCQDDLVPKWSKHGAERVMSYMVRTI